MYRGAEVTAKRVRGSYSFALCRNETERDVRINVGTRQTFFLCFAVSMAIAISVNLITK